MHTRHAKKIVKRFQRYPRFYSQEQVVEAQQKLGVEFTKEELKEWEATRASIQPKNRDAEMNKKAAKRIVGDFDKNPTEYSFSQIKKAHTILEQEIEDDRVKQWAAGHSDSPQAEELVSEPEKSKTTVVATIEAETTPGEDGVFGTEDDEIDYNSMTMAEMKAICKDRDLSGYSGLNKADLVDFLLAADQEAAES
jgi:hypothetical protein